MLMRLMEIVRVSYRVDGVFGVMLDYGKAPVTLPVAGEPFIVTCEEVWRNNTPRVSCIPVGRYICERVQSPKFGATFEITHVPGRSAILFHAGNDITDTEGCVLTAEQYGRFNGNAGVLVARAGFQEFMSRLTGTQQFALVIRDA